MRSKNDWIADETNALIISETVKPNGFRDYVGGLPIKNDSFIIVEDPKKPQMERIVMRLKEVDSVAYNDLSPEDFLAAMRNIKISKEDATVCLTPVSKDVGSKIHCYTQQLVQLLGPVHLRRSSYIGKTILPRSELDTAFGTIAAQNIGEDELYKVAMDQIYRTRMKRQEGLELPVD